MSPSSWNREKKLVAFLLGATAWLLAVVPLFVFHGAGQSRSALVRGVSGPAIAFGLVLALVLWFCSALGWRSFPVGGGGGFQLKLITVAVVAGTMVGMIPVAYWTGACLLGWLDRLRDPFSA